MWHTFPHTGAWAPGACPVGLGLSSLKLCTGYPAQATGSLQSNTRLLFVRPNSLALIPTTAAGLCSSQLGPSLCPPF